MDSKKFRDRLRYVAKKIDEQENGKTTTAVAWERQKQAAYEVVCKEWREKGWTVPELPMFTPKPIPERPVEPERPEPVSRVHRPQDPIAWLMVAVNVVTSFLIVDYTAGLYHDLNHPWVIAALFEVFVLIFSYEKPSRYASVWWLRFAAGALTISIMLKPTFIEALKEYSTLNSTRENPATELVRVLQEQVDDLSESVTYHRKNSDKYPDVFVSKRDEYVATNITPLEKALNSKRSELVEAQRKLSESPQVMRKLPIQTITKGLNHAYPMVFLFIFNISTAVIAGRRFKFQKIPRQH